ncbi:MAG: TonB-dependent receptor plug domain-containing protein, partial [Vicinamibacterales bacterium]
MKSRSRRSRTRSVSTRIRRAATAPVLALGAVATAMPVAAAAAAQDAPQQSPVPDRSQVTFPFNISAGPLDSVLTAFERITGIRVALANADLGTLPSPGVSGTMTARAAVSRLLVGTSLEASASGGGFEIAIAGLSEDVQVVGAIGAPAVSSPRYTVPLRDIAQTVALVPRAVIEQRVATTLTEVLRNVPGITLQAGEGGGASNTAGDMFNMRGFSANNSLFVDNVRDSGLIARDVFNVEQVEVFMGPNGSDVGRGTAAGYINMATKRPRLGNNIAVNATGGTASQGRVTADLNWSAPTTAGSSWWSHAAVRLNALWQDRGAPGRDHVKTESEAVAPSLLLGIGTPTRVLASAQIMRQDNLPDYGVPGAAWSEDVLAPTTVQATPSVRQANYYGSPTYDYDRANQHSYLVRVDRDLTRTATLANQTRYNRTHRDAIVSTIQNVAAYDPTTEQVTIARQGNERENLIVSNQTTLV